MTLYSLKNQKRSSERQSFINSDPSRYTIFSGIYLTSSLLQNPSERIYEKNSSILFFLLDYSGVHCDEIDAEESIDRTKTCEHIIKIEAVNPLKTGNTAPEIGLTEYKKEYKKSKQKSTLLITPLNTLFNTLLITLFRARRKEYAE